ncbi:MAG: DUF2087 domain-containing protein, partial [candidate division Zixibacteria bacterium]|nr:DUF2087 domain-containing protein [candidate division Zixibacteria bacterium]
LLKGDLHVPYKEGIIKNTEFMTTTELAKKLKMNVQVITRKVQAGEIFAYKIGKDWRIPEQSIYDWLEAQSNHRTSSAQKTAPPAGDAKDIKAPPARHSRRRHLLQYILAQFEPDRAYAEEDVHKTIARYHDDFAVILREFLDEEMMDRVNGTYRRRAGYRFSG